MRPICFHGRSLGAIRAFPISTRRDVGYQLDRVQRGLEPNDWKPLPQVAKGVKELRVRENGQFRVVYLAVCGEAVYVLHEFRKKTQKTRLHDIRAAQKVYKHVITNRHD